MVHLWVIQLSNDTKINFNTSLLINVVVLNWFQETYDSWYASTVRLRCHPSSDGTVTTTGFNTWRRRQNGRHFADDTFKRIFLNENVRISIRISLKFVPNGPVNNIPWLVQIMAWRRSGDKPLSETMMVSIYASLDLNELTHELVTEWPAFWATKFLNSLYYEKVLLKFVPMSPIKYNPSLDMIMPWCQTGDKPLSEPIVVSDV